MRAEIAASWSRSRRLRLRRDRPLATQAPETPGDRRLVELAGPVLDRVVDDVRGAALCLVLASDNARIVDRRIGDGALRSALDRVSLDRGFVWSERAVGTNAIGTSLERHRPIAVHGREHYAEALHSLACAASPITDPRTGRLLGALGLVCDVANASTLMLPYARRVTREIEGRMLDGSSAAERALLDHYVRARLRRRGPILAIDEHTMTTNASAGRVVAKADHAALWRPARRAVSEGRFVAEEVRLADGTRVIARCEPVFSGSEPVGALIRFDARATPEAGRRFADGPPGWAGLTSGQLSVAELVASGMTNREAAARLYVSPHTIDFHLRQIYTKLRISSRVELARLMAERHAALRNADTGRAAR